MTKAGAFRYFLCVTLVAFLLNATLPFFAVYDVSQAVAAESAKDSAFAGKVLICSSEGFRWVDWKDLRHGEGHPAPHSGYQCAMCYVTAHGLTHAAPAQEFAVLQPLHARYVTFAFTDTTVAVRHIALGLRTRAPPFVA